jgi:hypothetical protein
MKFFALLPGDYFIFVFSFINEYVWNQNCLQAVNICLGALIFQELPLAGNAGEKSASLAPGVGPENTTTP